MVKFPDTIHNIKVECVQVPEGHRPVDEATLALLVTSIEEIGLQTPISVQIRDAVTLSKGNKADSWVLLAGAHRLAAAKQLAWATIPAFVLSDDPARAQMWTVAENLHRKELSEIEQSDHVALWLHLHNAKVARDAPPSGGVQPTDAGVRRTARALGLDRRKVQRLLVVAGIAEEAKVEAKVLGLDDDQSALLKIAQCDPREQVDAVRSMAETSKSRLARKRSAVKQARSRSQGDELTEQKISAGAQSARILIKRLPLNELETVGTALAGAAPKIRREILDHVERSRSAEQCAANALPLLPEAEGLVASLVGNGGESAVCADSDAANSVQAAETPSNETSAT